MGKGDLWHPYKNNQTGGVALYSGEKDHSVLKGAPIADNKGPRPICPLSKSRREGGHSPRIALSQNDLGKQVVNDVNLDPSIC